MGQNSLFWTRELRIPVSTNLFQMVYLHYFLLGTYLQRCQSTSLIWAVGCYFCVLVIIQQKNASYWDLTVVGSMQTYTEVLSVPQKTYGLVRKLVETEGEIVDYWKPWIMNKKHEMDQKHPANLQDFLPVGFQFNRSRRNKNK